MNSFILITYYNDILNILNTILVKLISPISFYFFFKHMIIF